MLSDQTGAVVAGRSLRWQILLAAFGVVLLGALLANQALNRTTILVPDYGGTYVEGLAGRARLINPLLWQNEAERDLVSLIFEGLVRTDAAGNVVPDLARQWTVSQDGLTYTFDLRDHVYWQDGQPFTAADVAYTVGVTQDPAYTAHPEMADLWRSITTTVVSPLTIRFTLSEPYAPFLDHMSFGILPAHILRGTSVADLGSHPFNLHPVGTGPFRVESLDAEQVTLVPNLQYHGQRPYLDQLQFRFYSDYPTLFAAYERGEIQGAAGLSPDEVDRLAEDSRATLYSAETAACTVIFLNLNRLVFKDKAVRQALLLALDRQALVDQVVEGQAVVANSPVISALWAQDPVLQRYGYDPTAARALLDQAGWRDSDGDGIRAKGNMKLTFSLVTNADPVRERLVQAIAGMWEKIGVPVETQVIEPGRLSEEFLRPRHFDAVLYGWSVSYYDPDPYPLWHSTQAKAGGQNFTSFSNPEADAILEQARRTTDQATRAAMYRRFQQIFADEVPALLLYQSVSQYVVDQAVRNVQVGRLILDPSKRFETVTRWYVKTRREILPEPANAQRLVP
jgi:peptide/nickel transport system substrate-binding protein